MLRLACALALVLGLARNLLLWLLRCFLVARIFQLPLLLLGRGLSLLLRLRCELRRELRRRGDSFLLGRRRLLAGALLRRLAQLLLLCADDLGE